MLIAVVIFLIVILDQATKLILVSSFRIEDSISVIPGFFNLSYVRNTGAALGMFHDSNGLLVVFSAVVLVGLIAFHRVLLGGTSGHRFAAAMMVGGIIGNLMDRLRYGFVIDFLDFYWKSYHFWTFNVADCSICVGVAVYLLSTYLQRSSPVEGGDRTSPGPEATTAPDGRQSALKSA